MSDASGEVTPAEALRILAEGSIELLGLLPNSSNYTFLARVTLGDVQTLAVYKPQAGETPLRDFPEGTLYKREAAAYEASEMLAFGFVPPTIVRDGPHGIGSVQLFVDADPEQHYLTMPATFDDVFQRVCVYDLLINNADRKSGHCLLEPSTGHIWVVDHGVAFHAQPKLRTVIWDFAGRPIPGDALAAVRTFDEQIGADPGPFAVLLDEIEIKALRRRASLILEAGVFPDPGAGRPYPWPPV